MHNLTYKSIDLMKWTKDTIASQPSAARISGILNALEDTFEDNITHLCIAIPLNTNAQFVTAGTTPSPESVELMYARWTAAIRGKGYGVIHRGALCGMEGIYGFTHEVGPANRISPGTAASAAADGATTHLGKVYQWMTTNAVACIASGDIIAFLPERTEGIFSDSTSFLDAAGIQAAYSQFYIDLHAVVDERLSALGITGVITGYTANNYSEVNSGWIPSGLFTDAGVVAMDHYGSTHAISEMNNDLRGVYTAKVLPMYLQEWSDYWNGDLYEGARFSYLRSMYNVFSSLSREGKLIGFNYWGGWVAAGGSADEGILTDLGSDVYAVNDRGQLLAEYFSGTAHQLDMRSIDTMKLSRDKNNITNAQKAEHVEAIVRLVPDVTHITVDCYANNFGYQSVSYIKSWFDAVHNAGKPVLFRPAWGTISPNTVAGYKAAILAAAANLIDCWQDGDWWDVFPESSPTSTLWGGVAGWNTFVRETMVDLQAYFATQNLSVNTDLWSVTDSNVLTATRVEQATVDAAGNKVCIDFYPLDVGGIRVAIQSFYGQLSNMRARYPTADIYITETGFNNITTVTDHAQRNLLRHFFNEIAQIPYIKGFNYWVSYGDATYDKTYLFQSLSRTVPRPALRSLSEYYSKGMCTERQLII